MQIEILKNGYLFSYSKYYGSEDYCFNRKQDLLDFLNANIKDVNHEKEASDSKPDQGSAQVTGEHEAPNGASGTAGSPH